MVPAGGCSDGCVGAVFLAVVEVEVVVVAAGILVGAAAGRPTRP